MFIGHIGLGLGAKKWAPAASAGVLLLAGEALDVLCGGLMMTGVEHMRVSPGITAMTPLEFLSYPYSHGLLMSAVWSVLAGALGTWLYRSRRVGLVLGALVFSHWVLDWVSHRPDLPLAFDGSPLVGLGLWNSVAGTLAAEFGLLTLGVVVYLRSTQPQDRTGTLAVVSLVGFFTALFLLNHYGPQPPVDIPQPALAAPILAFVLLLPWGNWMDKHRSPRAR